MIVAIVLNGIAYKMISRGNRSAASSRGIVLALLAGLLMSFFYRFVAASMDLDNFVTPAAGKMTPYSAMVVFAVGIFLSTFIFNSIAMKRPVSGTPVSISAYFKGGFPIHLVGVLGGVIWGLGNALNLIAAGKAGAAISYGLGRVLRWWRRYGAFLSGRSSVAAAAEWTGSWDGCSRSLSQASG